MSLPRVCACFSMLPWTSSHVCAFCLLTRSSPPSPLSIFSEGVSNSMPGGVSGWSVSRLTAALCAPAVFPTAGLTCLPFLRELPGSRRSAISLSASIPPCRNSRAERSRPFFVKRFRCIIVHDRLRRKAPYERSRKPRQPSFLPAGYLARQGQQPFPICMQDFVDRYCPLPGHRAVWK